MKTIRKIQLLIMALVIAIGVSSCQNSNKKVVTQMIDEINEETAGMAIDGMTVLGAELEGKNVVFSVQFPAILNQEVIKELDWYSDSDFCALAVASLLDELSEEEANAMIDGKYGFILRYFDINEDYYDLEIPNEYIRDYFSEE